MLTLPVDLAAFLLPLAWNRDHWKGVIAASLVTVAIFALGGLYAGRRHVSFLDELPQLCVRLLAAAAVVAIVAAERHDSVDYVAGFMRVVAVSAGLVLLGRLLTRLAVVLARRRRWVEHVAVIVGGGPVAAELARLLHRYPEYGLHVVGFVDVAATGHRGTDAAATGHRGTDLAATGHCGADGPPLLGGFDQIEELIRRVRCEVVLIADVDCSDEELLRVARLPGVAACDLWVVPRLREFHARNGIPDHIGAIGVSRVTPPSLTGPQFAVKRAFDIVAAGVALVLLSPVLAACAVATRVEGGPGVLFRQVRVGRHGRSFELLKFRSMRPADEMEAQTTWSVADDPRLRPVGRFLRRTSLDELPQLWNILRGDMTVVGPRPERPYFVDQFSVDYPEYAMRHRVPVGLTGLAQVSGLRGDTPISDRARFDNYYIENWSLWLDVKVILRTILEVLRGGGR
ncbi:sugar transferase [Solwaraspora sp. WMMA2056]|nr:sugar transferase [Solwaraspora sp. WMMA2056]WJK44106.1 sugar transferase [Solwaraspora sp. WMMA2056]